MNSEGRRCESVSCQLFVVHCTRSGAQWPIAVVCLFFPRRQDQENPGPADKHKRPRSTGKGQLTTNEGPMKNYLKQLFSESGEASFSRVGSFLALMCALAWLSYIVWETRVVPSLDGVTFFVGSLYGLGKAGQTIQRLFGSK